MQRFKQILCVLENENGAVPALERAVSLAENNNASLTVAVVVPRVNEAIGVLESGASPDDLQAAIISEKQKALQSLVQAYSDRLDVQLKVLTGIPFLEIIREVLAHCYDLVMKMPDTADWLDQFFGSDDMHLLRKCPCPVWLVKPEASKPYRRILAAVDVGHEHPPEELKARNALNLQIIEMAVSLAVSEFAELHIVHVWQAIGESTMRGSFLHTPEEEIRGYVEQVRQKHENSFHSLIDDVMGKLGQDALNYLQPQTHLINGQARKEIPALTRQLDCDLVIMGTVGRTGIPGFIMGNTAETILTQIDCSVLAIKPPGFQTPVSLEV
jgi:nucleotide-binding universal stress UspA family protein